MVQKYELLEINEQNPATKFYFQLLWHGLPKSNRVRLILYRVFIKYFGFFLQILKYISDSGLSRFFLGVYTSCLDH